MPVSAIYDPSGTGPPDSAALAAFPAATQARWNPAPRYVVLARPGQLGPLDDLGGSPADLVPTGYVAFDTSLLNALVLKAQGGAIGGRGATVASRPGGQQRLNEAFYRSVLSGARLGDALRAGYAATGDGEVRAQFGLIGDPALRLDLGR